MVGFIFIQLGCEEFGRIHRFHHFNNFTCPETAYPVVFPQLCTFYHQGKLQVNSTNPDKTDIKTESVQVAYSQFSIPQSSNTETNFGQESSADNLLGQVWVSDTHQAICISTNSAKKLTSKTTKIQKIFLSNQTKVDY